MAHEITIGPNPAATADIQAALIRQDVTEGTAQPPGAHVQYEPPRSDGKDVWKSPAEVNATGKASCNSLPRAEAPFVDASHVGVAQLKTPSGETVNHAFLLLAPKPGEPAVKFGPDGKPTTPIPPSRIHDPSINRGANAGKPLDPELVANASYSPIWPKHRQDLSHVHAPPADRAAEGNAYQGAPRGHTPQTEAGRTVAAAAHLAARNVTPPVTHRPRPIEELYPGHPVLSAVGRAEDRVKGWLGWQTTPRMAREFGEGLITLAQGTIPAELSSDLRITPDHAAAAKVLHDFLILLKDAQAGIPAAVRKLELLGPALLEADPSTPEGDARLTVVSELDAMLPGVIPEDVTRHLSRRETIEVNGEAFDVFDGDVDVAPMFSMSEDDRDLDIVNPMNWALTEALGGFAVGHPHDGRRSPAPARDPRLGWAGRGDPPLGAPAGRASGGGGSPLAPTGAPKGGGSPPVSIASTTPLASATPSTPSSSVPSSSSPASPSTPSASLPLGPWHPSWRDGDGGGRPWRPWLGGGGWTDGVIFDDGGGVAGAIPDGGIEVDTMGPPVMGPPVLEVDDDDGGDDTEVDITETDVYDTAAVPVPVAAPPVVVEAPPQVIARDVPVAVAAPAPVLVDELRPWRRRRPVDQDVLPWRRGVRGRPQSRGETLITTRTVRLMSGPGTGTHLGDLPARTHLRALGQVQSDRQHHKWTHVSEARGGRQGWVQQDATQRDPATRGTEDMEIPGLATGGGDRDPAQLLDPALGYIASAASHHPGMYAKPHHKKKKKHGHYYGGQFSPQTQEIDTYVEYPGILDWESDDDDGSGDQVINLKAFCQTGRCKISSG